MTIRSMEKCGEQSKSTSNHRVETQSVHICLKKYAVGASLLFIKYMFMYMFILLRWGFSTKLRLASKTEV